MAERRDGLISERSPAGSAPIHAGAARAPGQPVTPLLLPVSFGGMEPTWERHARRASGTAPEGPGRLPAGVEPVSDLITGAGNVLGAL